MRVRRIVVIPPLGQLLKRVEFDENGQVFIVELMEIDCVLTKDAGELVVSYEYFLESQP